jgi:hypothetical protein
MNDIQYLTRWHKGVLVYQIKYIPREIKSNGQGKDSIVVKRYLKLGDKVMQIRYNYDRKRYYNGILAGFIYIMKSYKR